MFPALEAKEALRHVSHSYSLDHQQEAQLFNEMAQVGPAHANTHACVCSICSAATFCHYSVSSGVKLRTAPDGDENVRRQTACTAPDGDEIV